MGGYAELRGGFLQCHEDPTNALLHIITGLLGVAGVVSLISSCTRIPPSLPVIAYTVALLSSSAPLPLVVVVLAVLWVLVVPAVKLAHPGVWGSLAAVAIGYLGQDAAHYITGEQTFQSTYSSGGGGVLPSSLDGAAAWAATFSSHTFFLLPLTADAAARALLAPGSAARSFLESGDGSQPPAWLLAVQEHVWLLAVLALWVSGCYALDSDSGPFPWILVKRRVLRANLGAASLRKDLAAIRRWAVGHRPSRDTTTHWWFSDLPGDGDGGDGDGGELGAFTRVAECSEIDSMFREKFRRDTYCVETIPGMNEVYVSGPPKGGSSDAVFTTRHTDGPWALLPFCSAYRCILGLDSSAVYTTVFPNVPGRTTTCREGDVVCFDYHREIHYIEEYAEAKKEQAGLAAAKGGDGYRIVLKLHYVVYPRFLWPLGKLMKALSVGYNILFRNLFLFTLTPSSIASRFMAFWVVQVTAIYRMLIETGPQNILYVAALFAAGRLVHPAVFLVGTSFVHYLRYITTYYHRGDDVDFGRFKSDALFFKAAALSHIGCRYVSAMLATFPSASAAAVAAMSGLGFNADTDGDGQNAAAAAAAALSLFMVVTGSAVSLLATRALGVDGTYFGPELGVCEMKWVTAFPYNVVPHPMITGQLVAFMGIHLLPEFRAAWPWLMPAHCAFYLVVMMQEHFDVHARAGDSGRVAGYNGVAVNGNGVAVNGNGGSKTERDN